MLPPALKTGKLTIVANAMAREVMTDAEGLATGVSYIDTQTDDRGPGAGQGRGAGGELLRVGAAAAQLEVDAASRRPRQLERRASAST